MGATGNVLIYDYDLVAKTQAFIDGLRLAASMGEDVEFH